MSEHTSLRLFAHVGLTAARSNVDRQIDSRSRDLTRFGIRFGPATAQESDAQPAATQSRYDEPNPRRLCLRQVSRTRGWRSSWRPPCSSSSSIRRS